MISMSFLATVATLALVYAMAATAEPRSRLGRYVGPGVAGLIAVGAYSYVLLTSAPDAMVPGLGLPILAGMVGAGVITAIVAALIGWPALRLRGEYFLISTFAFAEIIRQLIIIGKDVTGGTFGITFVKRPFEALFRFDAYPYVLLVITGVLTLVVYLICSRVAGSVYGMTMRAARDNEPLAMATGTSVKTLRCPRIRSSVCSSASSWVRPSCGSWVRWCRPRSGRHSPSPSGRHWSSVDWAAASARWSAHCC